jgi:hypothetical protein
LLSPSLASWQSFSTPAYVGLLEMTFGGLLLIEDRLGNDLTAHQG